jgi:hypothetical protein
LGSATPARSTSKPGTTPGFAWPTTWSPAGGSARSGGATGPAWPRAPGTAIPSACSSRRPT